MLCKSENHIKSECPRASRGQGEATMSSKRSSAKGDKKWLNLNIIKSPIDFEQLQFFMKGHPDQLYLDRLLDIVGDGVDLGIS